MQISVELGKKEAEISRLMGLVTSFTERAEVAEKALVSYQSTELKGLGDEEFMRKKLNQLQTTVDLLKGERDSWQLRAMDAEKEFKARMSEVVVANERLEMQLGSMQSQHAKLESQSGDAGRMAASIKALETKAQELKRERDEYLSNLNAACDRISELEEQAASLQGALDLSRNSNVDTLRGQLAAMESSLQEVKHCEGQLKDTVSELTNRLKKSKDEIAMLKQELSRTQDQAETQAQEQQSGEQMQQLQEQLVISLVLHVYSFQDLF